MDPRGRAEHALRATKRWIIERNTRFILLAGWIVFGLCSYPGYMSFDSTLQLYEVRSGHFTDARPAVMTAIWSLCEYVAAGPLPMLALQSGLFLFGLFAILRELLSPRVAAITALCVLMFPPVFAPMAVIWPDSLMAGALVAGIGALAQASPRWKVTGLVLFAVACGCRPEAVFAIVPLVLVFVPPRRWWQRALIAVGITVLISAVVRITENVVTDEWTYAWQQELMLPDAVSTLRRLQIKKDSSFTTALAGLPIVDPKVAAEQLSKGRDAVDWWPLSHGDKRIFEPLLTDEQADALVTDWRHLAMRHPGPYLKHRYIMFKNLIGLGPIYEAVYDGFGDPQLLAGVHHRATASDIEVGWRWIVRKIGKTPLMRPWLYLLLAIGGIVLARRDRIARMLIISGLAYELSLFVFAHGQDYRYSHWLVASTVIAYVANLVARKAAWRAASVVPQPATAAEPVVAS